MSFNEVLILLNVYYQKGASNVFNVFDASNCMWQIFPEKNDPYFLVKEEIKAHLELNSAYRNQPEFHLIAFRKDFSKGCALDVVGMRVSEFGLTAFHDYFYMEKRNNQLKVIGLTSRYTKYIADIKVDYLKNYIKYEKKIDDIVEFDERHLMVGNLPDNCTKKEVEEKFSGYYPLKVDFQRKCLRKFAFITFGSEDIVKRVIKDMPKIVIRETYQISYRIPLDSDYYKEAK